MKYKDRHNKVVDYINKTYDHLFRLETVRNNDEVASSYIHNFICDKCKIILNIEMVEGPIANHAANTSMVNDIICRYFIFDRGAQYYDYDYGYMMSCDELIIKNIIE